METENKRLIGGVRITTVEGLIFQGQIIPTPNLALILLPGFNNQFVFLSLTCPVEILYNGTREDIQPPLYDEGDIVQINISKIIAIGPSGDCITDAP